MVIRKEVDVKNKEKQKATSFGAEEFMFSSIAIPIKKFFHNIIMASCYISDHMKTMRICKVPSTSHMKIHC